MRTKIEKSDVDYAIVLVMEKLRHRFNEKGPHSLVSRHEILGVIEEEMHELKDAVQLGQVEFLDELLDVTVACILGLSCANYLDW